VVPRVNRLCLQAAGTLVVQRLPHATGMRWWCRDSQGHGGKRAHERQNKQQSGGQAVHDWFLQRIGHGWSGMQVHEGYLRLKTHRPFNSQKSDAMERRASPPVEPRFGRARTPVAPSRFGWKKSEVSRQDGDMTTIVLLTISNIFMTFAWYGHLKYRQAPLFKVILASWGIAFFEYCFQVPGNRIGSYEFSAVQLKTIQEVITLTVFAVFSVLYLDAPIKWNYILGFALIVAAVFVIFKKW